MKKHLSQRKDRISDTKRKLKSPEGRLILKWGQQIPHQNVLRRSKVVFDIELAESDMIAKHQDILFYNRCQALDTIGSRRLLDYTFHYAMGRTLAIGQSVGLLPITGILDIDPSNLRFKWKSWIVAYSLLMIAGAATQSLLCLVRIFVTGLNIVKFGMLFFYTSVLLCMTLFFLLALEWESVSTAISSGEKAFLLKSNTGNKISIRKRFFINTVIFVFMAAFEHFMSLISAVASAYVCSAERNLIKSYATEQFAQIFEFTEYAPWKALLMQIWNIQATLIWNFEDLFIILVSLGMAIRFESLNEYLITSVTKHHSSEFWEDVRTQYVNLSQVVKKVDGAINKIIALTFSANLYLICHQMFNSLSTAQDNKYNPDDCKTLKERLFWPYLVDIVYFIFSFGFLVVRFLIVSLTAARLHSAAKQPKALLMSVASSLYCIEMERFLDQVNTDKIAFTGLNLFSITRGLILKIAGTVVTYELVLLQFNAPTLSRFANITISVKDFENNMTVNAIV